MNIAIATVQVPFIHGGAQDLAAQLEAELCLRGLRAERITLPFRFFPPEAVMRCMDTWQAEDFTQINGYPVERVICLSFPSYYLQHPHKLAWLIHQHRAVYELWDTEPSRELRQSAAGQALKARIWRQDTQSLAQCRRLYTISKEVSERLKRFNALDSQPLYHPPRLAAHLYCAEAEPYVFFPSRLEKLKRQDLLIAAMRHVHTPTKALIAGEGGMYDYYAAMISRYGLRQRVRLLGAISDRELLACYARCLAVFFGPFREDYGYVTLEAMLAAKPVICCRDSGGPLEFVVPGQTGYVVEPRAQDIARCIDELYRHRRQAAEMGAAGLEHYRNLGISWGKVIQELMQ